MLRKTLERIEAAVTELATRTGPILGPVPTAYLVGRATLDHLEWPLPIAIIAGVVVECLGLATAATALTLWDYNQGKRKSDPRAPFTLALALVAIYFLVAIGLNVALDVVPDLATVSPAIFPILSLTGTGILAIRADHRRRVAAIEADKEQRRRRRRERRQERKQAEAAAEMDRKREELDRQRAEIEAEAERKQAEIDRQRAAMEAEAKRKAAEAERKALRATLEMLGTEAETLRQYAGNPVATQAEIAEALGASERTVRNHLARLEGLGLVKRNGQGVELLVDVPGEWMGGNGTGNGKRGE